MKTCIDSCIDSNIIYNIIFKTERTGEARRLLEEHLTYNLYTPTTVLDVNYCNITGRKLAGKSQEHSRDRVQTWN